MLVKTNTIGAELPDLTGGHVDTAYLASVVIRDHIRSGKLRGLAVAGSKRVSIVPDVPTMAEVGYPLDAGVAIVQRDPKQVLRLLDEAEKEGLQLGELLDQLIAYWRDLMVVHCAGVEGRDLSVPSRHRETLLRQAKALNLDAILAGLDILSVAKSQLKSINHGRTLVEMALVRLGRLENLVALPYLVRLLHSQRGAAAVAPRADFRRSAGRNKKKVPGLRS